MPYLDPSKDTEIIADANPFGLGALLCQQEKRKWSKEI